MKGRGLSVAEIARLSGVPQPTAHRILDSQSADPRLSNLEALARGLGVDFRLLLLGVVHKAPEYTQEYPVVSEVRLENSRRLSALVGSSSAFAEAIDRESTQVSRFMGRRPTTLIGSSLARHIERSFCLPVGWMDQNWTGPVFDGGCFADVGNDEMQVPLLTLDSLEAEVLPDDHYVIPPVNCGALSYAVINRAGGFVNGPMWADHLRVGDGESIYFCDPDQRSAVGCGDVVVAKLDGSGSVVIRHYYEEGGYRALVPKNNQFPVITEDFSILSKVVAVTFR
ncbi:MAG: hypothetical protein CSH37_14035 [Thalassolituus sp.]|nr:MAG: hypothetical protein CSH37_14035 [Thalassolituus sp.]